jgi:hypothetical protein
MCNFYFRGWAASKVESFPTFRQTLYLSSSGWKVALGGLVVACLPLDPRFAGSNPAEDDGFLRVITIRSTTSFGEEVKPLVPCRWFTACKRTIRSWKKMLCKQNSVAMFLTHVSPASLVDGSREESGLCSNCAEAAGLPPTTLRH